MEFSVRNYMSICIVDLTGEIDLYNYNKVKEMFVDMLEKKFSKYIFNFEGVTYIDSSGIGSLIFINSHLKSNRSIFYFSGFRGAVKRVIELTKLQGFLPITENLQDAIKKIGEIDTGAKSGNNPLNIKN